MPLSHIKWLDVSSSLMHVILYLYSPREKPQWKIIQNVPSNERLLRNRTKSV